jgi:hypothetical protein
MRMPYWRFLLHIGLLSVAARRAIQAYVAFESHVPSVVATCLAAQAVFALLAAIAMWLRAPLQIASVVTLAAVVVASSIVQMFVLGERSVPLFVGQAMFAVVAATGVVMALRYADGDTDGAAPR